MKKLLRFAVAPFVVVCILGIMLPAWSSQFTECQIVTIQENTLFARTVTGEARSFAPYWISSAGAWVMAKPANTILPALESGEWVKIAWTLDTREGCRRIDGITILRATTGTTVGRVVSASATQLVIMPKDKPGTVTLNTRYVIRAGKSVPDPEIAGRLALLTRNAVVTVGWAWDAEGRKRITSLALGAPITP